MAVIGVEDLAYDVKPMTIIRGIATTWCVHERSFQDALKAVLVEVVENEEVKMIKKVVQEVELDWK